MTPHLSWSVMSAQLLSVPCLLLPYSRAFLRRCGKVPGPHHCTCAPSRSPCTRPVALPHRCPPPGRWRVKLLLPSIPVVQILLAAPVITPSSLLPPLLWMMFFLYHFLSHNLSMLLRKQLIPPLRGLMSPPNPLVQKIVCISV